MPDSLSEPLPDVANLQRLVAQHEAEIARQSGELLARDLLIEKLKLQLANLQRHRFGAKSEALDKIIDQLELALEEAEIAASRKRHDTPSVEPEAKGQPKRKPLPDHLPREDVVLSHGEACEQCGGTLHKIGEDVSETLEYVPGRFKVIRTVRPKLSCRCCETIHQASAPSMPIERGRPGPGLLAHVLVSKYADHLPLYRQSQIYRREDVHLERSTLSDWVGRSASLLEPLAWRISGASSSTFTPHKAPALLKRPWSALRNYIKSKPPFVVIHRTDARPSGRNMPHRSSMIWKHGFMPS